MNQRVSMGGPNIGATIICIPIICASKYKKSMSKYPKKTTNSGIAIQYSGNILRNLFFKNVINFPVESMFLLSLLRKSPNPDKNTIEPIATKIPKPLKK